MSPKKLSDRAILTRTKTLARSERAINVDILEHLIEIEHRELYLKLGYSSLFAYCTDHLRYSNSAAGRRVHAARCLRRFPSAAKKLRRGEINLSTLTLVAPILTEHNADQMLARIAGKSQRDVEVLVAEHRPPVAIRDRVRPVLTVVPRTGRDAPRSESNSRARQVDLNPAEPNPAAAAPANHSRSGSDCDTEVVKRLLVQFAASPDLMKKIERARAILSNRQRNLSFEAVFEAGLNAFLEKNCPKERAERRESRRLKRAQRGKQPKAVAKPAKAGRAERRAVPKAVRDAVHTRDGACCTYVGAAGRRCKSSQNLQVDHIVPVARGGGNEMSNLRLLCGKHNRLEAKRVFGDDVTRRYHDQE